MNKSMINENMINQSSDSSQQTTAKKVVFFYTLLKNASKKLRKKLVYHQRLLDYLILFMIFRVFSWILAEISFGSCAINGKQIQKRRH